MIEGEACELVLVSADAWRRAWALALTWRRMSAGDRAALPFYLRNELEALSEALGDA